jgi:hypothetical protein
MDVDVRHMVSIRARAHHASGIGHVFSPAPELDPRVLIRHHGSGEDIHPFVLLDPPKQ